MSDLFRELFADGETRQASAISTPNLPQSQRNSRKWVEQAIFRFYFLFEVILHLAVYSTIGWLAIIAFVIILFAAIITCPVWIPCGLVCLPTVIVLGILCKFTTLPTRSGNCVKDRCVKKFSWKTIFAVAKK